MANANPSYQEATIKTANDLMTVATTAELQGLSQLTLPEIEHLTNEIARVVPAGNIPALILSSLSTLDGRKVERTDSIRHVEALFRGLRQSLDKAIYTAFFATPATVIYGYQQILRLAGVELDDAFSEGTWQFYLEFALREDSARHTNEATGFHDYLTESGSKISDADKLAAWMLTAIKAIYQLPGLLTNEWREHIILKLLVEAAEKHYSRKAELYRGLQREWMKQLPYRREGKTDYPTYRREAFDAFWRPYYDDLPGKAKTYFDDTYAEAEANRLPAFIRQMTWLAYAEPGKHREARMPYALKDACLGIIHQDRYYLLPISEHTQDFNSVRQLAASILDDASGTRATLDDTLVTAARHHHRDLRDQLGDKARQDLRLLAQTPILINWDEHDAAQPLATLRSGAKRGIGDHPMTVIRTGESMVFDQSHIFFDGAWGAAVAQIMTYEAVTWARYLPRLKATKPGKVPYSPTYRTPAKLAKQAEKAHIPLEVSAENATLNLKTIQDTRFVLKQHKENAYVTVNDLLILYRSIHGVTYKPSEALQAAIKAAESNKVVAQTVREAIKHIRGRNPAILIPLDARHFDPRERVFPMNFRNPFTDFYEYHTQALTALQTYEIAYTKDERKAAREALYKAQITYIRVIGGFGELMRRYKEIAMAGQSASTTSIKFLAYLPEVMQGLLNNIPGRFDVLNEIIKGEEVFSNVGRVAPGSSLRRFISAKDDNDQKTLVWGVQTTAEGVAYITLRDFRPYVQVLRQHNPTLARHIVQDYLDSYVDGLNRYMQELHEIAVADVQKSGGLFSFFRS